DRVVAAARRAPPSVLGDGVSTIRALVDRENARPERGEGHESALTKIALDETSMRQLQLQRYTPETVLPAGATAVLRGNANLSTGGTAQDVTDAVHPDVAAACVRAANAVGLDVAGVDLVCTSVAEPLGDKAGAVVEVNAAPGIRMHERPSLGCRRDAGGAIVDALFDGVPACIPIIAVTGTNGKTTTVRLIEHAIRLQGYRTGMANSEGVYRHGRLVSAGDCSGYWSAQSVLAAPDIDAAVLEVARGGILKRGLGFKACDVAVVLNVDRDHLGQDGITDIEGIARVKAVVADSATRTVVLNADDPHCIAMAQDLPRKIEVIYFSMSYNNGVIVNHLENGGRALCLAGDSIVQRSASHDDFLVQAAALPVTLGGAARHNVANALAALAALLGGGFNTGAALSALQGFDNNAQNNPLRLNMHTIDGVLVLVDYAHNVAAYRAIAATARNIAHGRVVGVVTAPGDRRDEDLADTGEVCAQLFDELIIYEMDDLRDRPQGQVYAAISRGIPADVTHRCIADVREALAAAVLGCVDGDIVVLGCASELSDVKAAMQLVASQKQRRVEPASGLIGLHPAAGPASP
ncbi:MAG TPA: Mur ligase family protein, partial [Burkholderiales bacterium]|nr:Mur ligase family protein [Burkholderiales bacterium]